MKELKPDTGSLSPPSKIGKWWDEFRLGLGDMGKVFMKYGIHYREVVDTKEEFPSQAHKQSYWYCRTAQRHWKSSYHILKQAMRSSTRSTGTLAWSCWCSFQNIQRFELWADFVADRTKICLSWGISHSNPLWKGAIRRSSAPWLLRCFQRCPTSLPSQRP